MCVGLVQSGHHVCWSSTKWTSPSSRQNKTCSHHDMTEQSFTHLLKCVTIMSENVIPNERYN